MKLNRRSLLASLGVCAAAGTLPGSPAPAQSAGEPTPPDLGDLHDTIRQFSREGEANLSFLNSDWKSVESWKQKARPVFLEHLHYTPDAKPLSARLVKREERDGFTLETVRVTATDAYDIPAWILIPKGRKGRLPGVLAIHCHGGCYVLGHEKILSDPDEHPYATEYRDRAYGRAYPEELARRGYVVMVIDGFYFGERRLRPEDMAPETAPPDLREGLRALAKLEPNSSEWLRAIDRVCSRAETLTAKTLFTTGVTWPGLLVWDDMRSIDYLCSRPEVDSGRIGCVGLSIGALRTVHLIAADPRIKVACATGWMTEFPSQLRNHLRHHTWMIYIPGLYERLDLPDAAALTMPGALFILQCSQDRLYPMEGMKGSVEKLKRIYSKAGMPERFRGSFYDVPHSFRPDMQDDAFEWIDKWI